MFLPPHSATVSILGGSTEIISVLQDQDERRRGAERGREALRHLEVDVDQAPGLDAGHHVQPGQPPGGGQEGPARGLLHRQEPKGTFLLMP